MLVVEVRGRERGDEKLAAVRVGAGVLWVERQDGVSVCGGGLKEEKGNGVRDEG